MSGRSTCTNLSSETNFRTRCRICLMTDEEAQKKTIYNVCDCKGASGNVHIECLAMWINMSGRDHCELCLQKINLVRTPKFSVCSSLGVFLYNNRTSQVLMTMIILGLIVYLSSIWYMDQLLIKPQTILERIFVFLMNITIFLSVFIISYSPLICLYLWDSWSEWRKSQFVLQIKPRVVLEV